MPIVNYGPGVLVNRPRPDLTEFVNRPQPDWSEFENDPRYRLIRLTQGCTALVDADDFPELSRHTWCAQWNKGTQSFYVIRNIRKSDGSHSTVGMHTELTGYPTTDHINGVTLDNRSSNLRDATRSQNAHNQTLRRNNTSDFKCVSLRKDINKWEAYIRVNDKQKNLGYFAPTGRLVPVHDRYGIPDPIDWGLFAAARVYDNAARALRGEYACVNFPNPGERSAITGNIREV
jgi:hypothetical protein